MPKRTPPARSPVWKAQAPKATGPTRAAIPFGGLEGASSSSGSEDEPCSLQRQNSVLTHLSGIFYDESIRHVSQSRSQFASPMRGVASHHASPFRGIGTFHASPSRALGSVHGTPARGTGPVYGGSDLCASPSRVMDAEPPTPDYITTMRELQEEAREPTVWSHFAALMRKNATTKWRDLLSTLAELLLPVVFVCGLVVVWAVTDSGFVPSRQFVDAPMSSFTETLSALCIRTGHDVPSLVHETGIRDCNATDLLSPTLVCKNSSFYSSVKGLCSVLPAQSVYKPFLKAMGVRRIVPTLDELVLMQWAYWLDDDGHTSTHNAVLFPSHEISLANSGSIYFSPKGPAADGLINYFNRTSKMFKYINGGALSSASDLEPLLTNKAVPLSKKRTLALVSLSEWSNTSFGVVYSFNRSGVPTTKDVHDEYANGLGEFMYGGQFLLSGFATIQSMVGKRYIEQFGAPPPGGGPPPGSNAADEQVVLAPMPFTEFDASEFLSLIGDLAPLFLVFGYLYSVSQLTKKIVEEKESRMREAMLIMGLGTGSFYTSWVVTYMVIGAVGAALLCGLVALTVLPKAMPIITFMLFLLFAASTVTLSSLLATFFSKSRVSALVAPVIFFAMAIPSFAGPRNVHVAGSIILSLMSPTAFARGATHLFNHEKTTGSNGSNFTSDASGFPMIAVFGMLLFDTVAYFLLALYLDAVLPSEWGTRKHPLFFLPSCLFGEVANTGDGYDVDGKLKDGRDPNGAFEDVQRLDGFETVDPTVRLLGLRKEFDTPAGHITAVDDLSYDLYEGEVAVLLGHNGAGKTTSINLMTGMLDMTAGDCTIYGASVRDDIHTVRREIGFCPQHNILWDGLTCKEHLEFFARVKGYSGEAVSKAADAMLAAVDLSDKADVPSAGLSGGQKRKLSVGIAFVGGSKMVFLDEPTAGMDVAARRFTWDLIKQMSPGRTIILTTHFMDEADLLGNTVAIMSKGSLRCAGSPVFLKCRLGVGYTLTMSCDKDAHTDVIQAFVLATVPAAETLTAAAGEIAMRLPMSAVPTFHALLSALEKHGGRLGIRGHGLSVTTLEEIFLNIGKDDHHSEGTNAVVCDGAQAEKQSFEHVWETITAATAASTMSPIATAWSQSKALMMKRFHNAKRDRRTQVLQVVLPTVCVLLALFLSLLDINTLPDLDLEPAEYGTTDTAYGNCGPNFAQFASPSTVVDTSVPATPPAPGQSSQQTFWRAGNALSQHLLDTAKTHKNPRLTSFVCPPPPNAAGGPRAPFIMNNETGWLYSAAHAIHEYYSMHTKAVMKNPKLRYRATVRHLPLTSSESVLRDTLKSVLIGIFIMIPFTFIPSTFVAWIVKEKQCKAKHMQIICGMDYIVYWVSNFCFDIMSFLFTTVLVIVLFLSFSREEYVGDVGTFFATFLLFFFYGLASVSGSYLVSFAFKCHATAQNAVLIGNFVAGFILVLATHALTLFPSTASMSDWLPHIFRVWPSFCLGNGIISLSASGVFSDEGADSFSPWQMEVTGGSMLYLAIEAPLFFLLTLVIDHPTLIGRCMQRFRGDAHDTAVDPIEKEDADVAEERAVIETSDVSCPENIVMVQNLRHVYPATGGDKVAVRDLSFGVRKGEVFGFLGTNGAGKTTTMSVLAGEFTPTGGDAWVAGQHVVCDAAKARKLLGFCPQFDALLDLVTVEEHLELYAGLRGIHGPAKASIVEALLSACDLEDHRFKETRALSGGNKRKLSVAMALVGGPLVVLLDEPSAGMDPMARRGLWDVLEVVAKHCSIVLTTHHLEEVEALASRVTIMDHGQLRCLGSLQHLKSTLGSGFEMSIRVDTEDAAEAADSFIESAIPQAALQESRNRKLTYALPSSTKLSAVFQVIEGHKASLQITDYSVSQTSLESVFLNISKAAHEEEEAHHHAPF